MKSFLRRLHRNLTQRLFVDSFTDTGTIVIRQGSWVEEFYLLSPDENTSGFFLYGADRPVARTMRELRKWCLARN